MSSRARSENSVSLFPFLAVLVCAMGALIFLLIVTTQRIRTETVARKSAARKQQEIPTKPVPVITPEPKPEPELVEPSFSLPITPLVVEREIPPVVPETPREPDRIEPIPGLVSLGTGQSMPILPPPEVLPAPPAPPEPAPIWPAAIAQKPNPIDPNIALRDEYAELERIARSWQQLLAQKNTNLTKQKAQAESLTAQLKRINQQIDDANAQRGEDRKTLQELQIAQRKLFGQLAKIQQDIEQTQTLAYAEATKFQVVPFDGQTGTNYRPILIECTAAGMRFQPEGVLLQQDDFDGFTVVKNPLLAGAKALSDYWMKKSVQSNGDEPEPYVLLIVRPSGAKYYAARKLLEELDRPFGYELVEENLPIEIPPLDPVAAELCRTAVERTLAERNNLRDLLATHGPEMLSRNPKYRVIQTPEGGFEVEYAPGYGAGIGSGVSDRGGNFPNGGLANRGNPNRGFGSRNEGPLGNPIIPPAPGNGFPGTPGGTRPSGSPRPNGNGERPGPGNGFRSSPPRPTGSGGTRTIDPNEPGRLPSDIIRRSQGKNPYRETEPNGTGGTSPTAPGSTENLTNPNQSPRGNPRQPNGSGTGQQFSGTPGDPKNPDTNNAPTDGPNTQSPSNPSSTSGRPNGGQPGTSTANAHNSGDPKSSNDANPNEPQTEPLPNSASARNRGQSSGSGSSSGGQPGSAFEPEMPNFMRLNSRRSLSQQTPLQRRWGLSDPRASIGFEREVTIRIESTRLVVGNAFAVNYDAKTTKNQLSAGMLEAVELVARKWGRPPLSFYWVPTLKFELAREQAGLYRELDRTAKSWGLQTTAKAITPEPQSSSPNTP